MKRFVTELIKKIMPDYAWFHLKYLYEKITIGKTTQSSTEYWNSHHVTFQSSPDFVNYRRQRYFLYDDLMPTKGHDNKTILDYGCGPGIESLSLLMESKNVNLYFADVSQTAIGVADKFIKSQGFSGTPILLDHDGFDTKLPDHSVDYIHCTGVLHHTAQPKRVLMEFARILKPDGEARLMVYHKDSLYFILYVEYLIQKKYRLHSNLTSDDAFKIQTDGPNCPISRAWTEADVRGLCDNTGLKFKYLGTGYEPHELECSQLIPAAIYDERTTVESRSFLKSIKFDDQNLPYFISGNDLKIGAGLQLCFSLTKHEERSRNRRSANPK